jgi:anhydro-N-acetylmuramic acid kinase
MLYIGLMSGTSMDAVDAVLLSADNSGLHVLAHHSNPIPLHLHQSIHLLSHPGNDSVALLGETDRAVGTLFAQTALELIAKQNLVSTDIKAIGSHGQTIRHCPPSRATAYPYTVQIGDPNLIAAVTGITTVADFRRKDVALGGEGAPLVPAFHQAVFRSETRNRAIVNIGGIANITWLPP